MPESSIQVTSHSRLLLSALKLRGLGTMGTTNPLAEVCHIIHAEEFFPTPCDEENLAFDDLEQFSEVTSGNLSVVVGENTAASLRNPDFCTVGSWLAFGDMNVNGFASFIRPKVNFITEKHE